MIKGDSTDYDLLEKWCKNFDCQGYKTVEIGVREGMGSYIMMEYLKNYFVRTLNLHSCILMVRIVVKMC